MIRAYRRLLHERPFITNILTTTFCMVAGDTLSQWILLERVDFNQTARFGIAGLIFVGPVVRGSLVMIDKIFGPTKSLVVLGKKLVLDQGICAPSFLAGNITILTLLKTQSLKEAKNELHHSYLNLLKLNYSFWPFVQVINFYFIPLTYRVLFGSSAALAWNTLFSYRLYNNKKDVLKEVES